MLSKCQCMDPYEEKHNYIKHQTSQRTLTPNEKFLVNIGQEGEGRGWKKEPEVMYVQCDNRTFEL